MIKTKNSSPGSQINFLSSITYSASILFMCCFLTLCSPCCHVTYADSNLYTDPNLYTDSNLYAELQKNTSNFNTSNFNSKNKNSETKKKNSNTKKQNIGIMLCSDDGTVLFSQNAKKSYIPASIMKILTSLAALHYLGDEYRFQTRFYLNSDNNNNSGNDGNKNTILKIKGYGDPLLTSETLDKLCHELALILKSLDAVQIKGIVLDHSFFNPDIKIDGTGSSNNPYDAFTGALCANFNSVFFKYAKTEKRYITAESQTPLLPFVIKRIKASASKMKYGRVILSKEESKLYAGMLIQYFLSKEGITITGDVKTGNVQQKDTHIYTYKSQYDIKEIIQKLLQYSNNFTANQLFLTSGAARFYSPATVEKGAKALTGYASEILGLENFKVIEGSGLSRQNRISPADMIRVLEKFKGNHELMLSEKNERFMVPLEHRGEYKEFYKTGTLYGVRTRCGYFKTPRGLYPFVIMINRKGAGYDQLKQNLWKTVLKHGKDQNM